MPDGHAYCDGGVWANSPAVVAVAEAMKIRQLCNRPVCDRAYDTSSIQLLSIGTGRATYSLKPPGADAELIYRASRIADVMGISQMQGAQLPMEFVLGDRYHPVDFDLTNRSWTLDGVQHIAELMALGRETADLHAAKIQQQFLIGPTSPYVPFRDSQAVQEVL